MMMMHSIFAVWERGIKHVIRPQPIFGSSSRGEEIIIISAI